MFKGILGTSFAAALGAMTIGSEISPSDVNTQEHLYEAQANNARTSWGIGITFFRSPAHYTVISSVMKGGPADQAGLCPGDVIVAYERQGRDLDERQNMLDSYKEDQDISRWTDAMNQGKADDVIYLRNGSGKNDWVVMNNMAPIPFGWENDTDQIAPVCSN